MLRPIPSQAAMPWNSRLVQLDRIRGRHNLAIYDLAVSLYFYSSLKSVNSTYKSATGCRHKSRVVLQDSFVFYSLIIYPEEPDENGPQPRYFSYSPVHLNK